MPLVDVHATFEEVPLLGAQLDCLVVAKRTEGIGGFAHRQASLEGLSRFARYLLKIRPEIARGRISRSKISDLASVDRHQWTVEGPEPHDIIWASDKLIAAFCGEIRILDPVSGAIESTIVHEHFANLHSVSARPRDSDKILIANPGFDDVIEFSLSAGTIVRTWRPIDHGFDIGPFGIPVVSHRAASSGREVLDADAAHLRLASNEVAGDWAILADSSAVSSPRWLEKWQRAAEPNWAGYDETGEQLLASLFCGDAIIRVDIATGTILTRRGGLTWPHGVIRLAPGRLLTTDTGRAHVHIVDDRFETVSAFDFSTFPVRDDRQSRIEWLQFTCPLDADTFATVDARRCRLYIWQSEQRIYSIYPFPPDILLKLVRPAKKW